MIDVVKLLLRLNVCTACYKHLRRHCPYCWACDENHRCDRKLVAAPSPRSTLSLAEIERERGR